ncbi:MAG: hypothetical protein Crog4KO_13240 [Crocinitomicaceae bacterium]
MVTTSSSKILLLLLLFCVSVPEVFAVAPTLSVESEMDRPGDMVLLNPVNYSTLDSVKKNGKLELSVSVPGYIRQEVVMFINRGRGDRLNPFDPMDLDITVLFMHKNDNGSVDTLKAYGFYYQQYRRNGDLKGWGEIKDVTHSPFRVRFTPQEVGAWECQAQIKVKGETSEALASPVLTFNVVKSRLEGFMKISENNHYLEVDDKLFLPLGMNMPTQGGPSTGFRSTGANPSEYAAYHSALEELSNAGGNYFRYMTTPWTTEVEFEVLGDYTDRLPQAWEMDQVVEKCEDLGLRMHWNMSYMTQLTYIGVFGLYFWDWTDARDSMATCADLPNWFPNDIGFCYHTDDEHGVETIDEFLTDRDLIRYYQNRLRYMIARWGYSTSIGTLELFNEINYSGLTFGLKDNCQLDYSTEYKPYFNDTSYVRKLSDWQIEMGRFIKEDLEYFDHPYCVNFGGAPNYATPDEYPYDPEDGASLAAGDVAYFSKYVDIMSYNDYYRWLNKFQYQHEDLLKMKRFAKKNNFEKENYDKPVMYSEVGMGLHGCDEVFTFRQLYVMSPFTGAAGPGMPWYYNNNTPEFDSTERRFLGWSVMPVVENFFSDVPLHEGNWVAGLDIRNDELAELLFLTEKASRSERAVAVINNRTVNRYTMREAWCDENPDKCDCDLQERELEMFPDKFESAQAFDWNDKRGFGGGQMLKVSGMEYTSKYTIVYYDAFTGEVVMETTKWSDAFGRLKLKYPELAATPDKEGGASNGSMLMVKIFKSDLDSFSTAFE